MKLKLRYSDESAIPETLRDYYVEQDRKWVLNGFVETEFATSLQEKNAVLLRQVTDLQLERLATRTAIAVGVPPCAVEDVINRVQAAYEVRHGQAVPRDPSSAPHSLELFLGRLRQQAPHLFEAPAAAPGVASNAPPAASKPADQDPLMVNPWKKGSFNLTRQNQIAKRDPGLARRLAAEAGVELKLR